MTESPVRLICPYGFSDKGDIEIYDLASPPRLLGKTLKEAFGTGAELIQKSLDSPIISMVGLRWNPNIAVRPHIEIYWLLNELINVNSDVQTQRLDDIDEVWGEYSFAMIGKSDSTGYLVEPSDAISLVEFADYMREINQGEIAGALIIRSFAEDQTT